ncbi:hypothetical protein D3C77_651960 [compost metagenome]
MATYSRVYTPDFVVSTLATVALLYLIVRTGVMLPSLLSVAVTVGFVKVPAYATEIAVSPL